MSTTDTRPERGRLLRSRKAVATCVALAGVAAASVVAGASSATAADSYERGPAPTAAGLETNGSFAVSKTSVPFALGFGGGTIYYPTTTSVGTFGGVVVAPGFTENQSQISWYGPRLASHGFVVFTIDTNSGLDQPDSRARQMASALTYLTNSSAVTSRVDKTRLAVMGHSMGGGGTLEAARANPALKAAIPLTGWDMNKNFSSVTVPTLVIGAQNDLIAPAGQHSIPFYNSLPASTKKEYVELGGTGHLAPLSPNATISRFSISWLKRWVDNDTRYSPFLCNVSTSWTISSFRSNCPF
jgi:pimeloyl-ACP methyl ester carboxylesterase